MRPRQSSLGIVASRIAAAVWTPGFNEAEAIKPRNHQVRADDREDAVSFNEAEAIKPRNPVSFPELVMTRIGLQ